MWPSMNQDSERYPLFLSLPSPLDSGSIRFRDGQERQRDRDEKAGRGNGRSEDLAKSARSSHSLPGFNILMRYWICRSNKERQSDGGKWREREGPFSVMRTGQRSCKKVGG